MTKTFVAAGKLFYFSTGEYSDYSVEGAYLALRDLTTATFQEAVDSIKRDIATGGVKGVYSNHVTTDSDDYEKTSAITDLFVGRLIESGALMVIDAVEIHRYTYGEMTIDGVNSKWDDRDAERFGATPGERT